LKGLNIKMNFKKYSELTERGKANRLRKVALRALENYDLSVKKVRLLTVETNTYFRIDTSDGRKYAMRVYSNEETTLKDNLAEVFWLNAINRDTDIPAPRPVPIKNGGFIALVDIPETPDERRCVIFEWIPGKSIGENISIEDYYKLGRIQAQLHDHAAILNPPPEIRPKRWDKVFYYPDEPVVVFSGEYDRLFDSHRRKIIEKTIARADDFFKTLYSDESSRILIHGDLHYYNVHSYRGRLHVIDFEDIMWGYPIQDIAVTFYYGNDRDDYFDLCEAYREGYSTIRPWPVESREQIDILGAARAVMFINYVARIHPDPEDFIDNKCRWLEEFLKKY
jgi:Ser/Thr protein kinase RdoA (MazF antagonist)